MSNAWLSGENQNVGSGQRETRWLTPKPLVQALGSFDLDPAGAPDHELAERTYLLENGDDGLRDPWTARVWTAPESSTGRIEPCLCDCHSPKKVSSLARGAIAPSRPRKIISLPDQADLGSFQPSVGSAVVGENKLVRLATFASVLNEFTRSPISLARSAENGSLQLWNSLAVILRKELGSTPGAEPACENSLAESRRHVEQTLNSARSSGRRSVVTDNPLPGGSRSESVPRLTTTSDGSELSAFPSSGLHSSGETASGTGTTLVSIARMEDDWSRIISSPSLARTALEQFLGTWSQHVAPAISGKAAETPMPGHPERFWRELSSISPSCESCMSDRIAEKSLRVWNNPPYGKQAEPFLRRLVEHGTGTALLFARTETKMFHELVWAEATAILFLKGRLVFWDSEGKPARANAGAPSCLVAYGEDDAQALAHSGLAGRFVWLASTHATPLEAQSA